MKPTLTALNSLKSESALATYRFWQGEGCQGFYHKNCDFDTLANDYICDPFVDDILNYLEAHFIPAPAPGPPNFCGVGHGYWNQLPMFSRCHIIDMNPYNEYFVSNYPIQYPCPQSCNKRTWLHAVYNGVSNSIVVPGMPGTLGMPGTPGSEFKERSFNGSIMNCDNYVPSSHLK